MISTLERHKLYEQAGKLHESTGRPEQAFKNYRQAAAFSQAIQLARNVRILLFIVVLNYRVISHAFIC